MFIDDEKIMLENVAKRSISYLELVVKLLGNHWQDLRTEKLECSVTSVMSNSLQPHGQHPARLPCSRDLPAKNTGVGCHALLQRIFPIQGLNPMSLSWQVDSLPLNHLESHLKPDCKAIESQYAC